MVAKEKDRKPALMAGFLFVMGGDYAKAICA